MMKRDILADLYKKKITHGKAQILFNKMIDPKTKDFLDFDALQYMNIHEWFSIAYQNIPLEVVAEWRYKGWPETCALCYKKCDVTFGKARPIHKLTLQKKTKYNTIVHFTCLEKLENNNGHKKIRSPYWNPTEKAIKKFAKKQNIKITKSPSEVVAFIVKRLEHENI